MGGIFIIALAIGLELQTLEQRGARFGDLARNVGDGSDVPTERF